MKNAPWITALTAVVFLLGLVAIAAGCALLHPAAGLIVGGALAAYAAHRLDATAGASSDARR